MNAYKQFALTVLLNPFSYYKSSVDVDVVESSSISQSDIVAACDLYAGSDAEFSIESRFDIMDGYAGACGIAGSGEIMRRLDKIFKVDAMLLAGIFILIATGWHGKESLCVFDVFGSCSSACCRLENNFTIGAFGKQDPERSGVLFGWLEMFLSF